MFKKENSYEYRLVGYIIETQLPAKRDEEC